MNYKKLIPILIVIALMVIAYLYLYKKPLTFETIKMHHDTLKTYVASHPLSSPLIFILLYIITAAFSLPIATLLSLIGGFLFPQPLSTLYVVIGATIGATILFLAARTALGELLYRKAGTTLTKMEAGFNTHPTSYLLFLRFIPLFPFWVVNLAAAFFRVRTLTYIWTTLVGIIPGALVYTQGGRGLSAIFESGTTFSLPALFNIHVRIALLALALFSLIPMLVLKLKKMH